jgi:hypothetical protein
VNRERAFVLFFIATVFLGAPALAQLSDEQIRTRDELEEFLRSAEIVGSEEIGRGVTRSLRLRLRAGETERFAVWKGVRGKMGGYLEGWQYEIAAYEMDRFLGVNMIPPTVEREFQDRPGSLQLWVENEGSLRDLLGAPRDLAQSLSAGSLVPEPRQDHVQKRKYLAWAFDSLIANDDLTQENILYTEDWRIILIDHSRSFRSSRKYTTKLLYGREFEGGPPRLYKQLPHEFVARVRELDLESLQEVLGSYLTPKEIQAILKRKPLLLAEIDQIIRERGEDAVLY